MRTKETVVKCSIEDRDVFVNVLGIDGRRGLDENLPELGGRSVKKPMGTGRQRNGGAPDHETKPQVVALRSLRRH
jgi:hypothetical protein